MIRNHNPSPPLLCFLLLFGLLWEEDIDGAAYDFDADWQGTDQIPIACDWSFLLGGYLHRLVRPQVVDAFVL